MPTAIDNHQPTLAVTEVILTNGIYPSFDDGSGYGPIVIGAMRQFAFNFAPGGFQETEGQLLTIASNTALFSIVGTSYGGNGTTTFGLPDQDQMLTIGAGQGPGLSGYYLGDMFGGDDYFVHQYNLPVSRGGFSFQIDNSQPTLAARYVINLEGTFNSGQSTDLARVWQFAGGRTPSGTAECAGQLLPISQYDALYALIGTTYGGDGVTTFALPDLRGRTAVGANGNNYGMVLGSETLTLQPTNLPGEMGGAATSLDNHQPSLVMRFLIATSGIFPSSSSNSSDYTEPYLGEIVTTAGSQTPNGFVECNGQLLSIQQNQALFALLGTNFGGNGVTTFALPDLRGRSMVGEDDSAPIGTTDGTATVTLTLDHFDALYLTGTAGNDSLYGANLDDVLLGNDGNDTLVGNNGNDIIDGGTGADAMTGGAGHDILVVDDAGDVVNESAGGGDDLVQSSISYTLAAEVENLTLTGTADLTGTGNSIANVINGNSGANAIYGLEGNDSLYGNGGNDTLDGGLGSDAVYGGAGDDLMIINSLGDEVYENAGEGDDTVQSSVDHTLTANVERLTLVGVLQLDGTGNALANVITGNIGNNVLQGLDGDDVLFGNGGHDTLVGNDGNDQLHGDVGVDSMTGGLGDDAYWVDSAGDTVIEAAGEGTDTVRSTISTTLGDNVENLILYGTAAVDATGNGLANIIFGNGEANVIDGGAGADSMRGGFGDDNYVVDSAGDRVLEGVGAGTDTVTSSLSFVLGPNVENLILSGNAAINGNGNALANSITGNSAANILNGLVGADTMAGGDGNDIYFVDNVGDSAVEDGGQGTDLVKSSVSFTLGDNVENLLLFGLAAVDATGNALANTLTGNTAANTLTGLGGNDYLAALGGSDRLDGGDGVDQLIGGAGSDLFVFASTLDAANADWIRDFSVADDSIVLDGTVFMAMAANGALSDAEFHTGTAAADADDRIIYNSANGFLYYDADGSGAGAQVQFARVAIGLGISAADFIVEGGLFGG